MGTRKIGLALSGGVVRGMAHLGVLTVLHCHGIEIDVVAGTSAGSIMGAMVAAGYTPAEIQQMSLDLGWRTAVRPVWPRDGFFSMGGLEKLFLDLIGDIDFADLELPFAAVAMDINSGEEVVITEGRLAPAVMASCSVPGFFTPVHLNGRALTDGGIINNLPVTAARDLGADFVIGVDIFEPHYGRRYLGPLGNGLAAIETMVDRAGGGVELADCLIQPNLAGMTYLRFSQRDALFQRGAQAAMRCMPALRQALCL
ncbi:MAG: patatin-like phospholipase family protein [Ardenticatenales bacterium]|nr:patatin-like phospholipase family protein [Ardenticatenales bacterium]